MGPYEPVKLGVTEQLDYEVELGVVIGEPAKGVPELDVRRHVFGYLVANDVSARDWQFHSPTCTMGQSFDTHGPIGPFLVTADEVPDLHKLELRYLVNAKMRLQSNASEMIVNAWQQTAYLATAFTLESGDPSARARRRGSAWG